MDRSVYQEPLVSRYTSREMQELFSEKSKFTTWRKCWVALAEAQHELGLDDIVTKEMVQELKDNPKCFGERIIFIHTGGIFGLFPKAEELEPLL